MFTLHQNDFFTCNYRQQNLSMVPVVMPCLAAEEDIIEATCSEGTEVKILSMAVMLKYGS